MIGVAVFSLLLLALSGVMIDRTLRVARRRLALPGLPDRDRRFFQRQHLRRMQANIMIGLVGVLVAVWPIVQQSTPGMKIAYLALMLAALLWMVLMAIFDALAITRRYRHDRMEQIAEQARSALEAQRKKLRPPPESPPPE